ncbi:hypothetical protein QNH47_11775 [Virgibacillus halodenitrificans]|uniref:hypothetical protein n=1 Tax=Virgibacillus halodenitrificans TaxID=1482 RepID=UPI0024C03B45|nr:hypothetical protein [Virgibacillus halodenitrificans]WHX24862.1 hypothetical protein QNH47_11775 [Virgibacillus halodenitrificans]
MISDLILDREKNIVIWNFDGNTIKVKEVEVDSGTIIQDLGLVLLIDEKVKENKKLLIYTAQGKKMIEANSPNGYHFSYVTTHPKIEPAVVCYEDKSSGWQDWYFSIDLKTGEFKKHGKAY